MDARAPVRGDRITTRISRRVMPLVYLYAEERSLYVEEAISRLVAKGLAAEKGLVITGDKVGIYGPSPTVTEEEQRQATD